ncbi:MAG TPA: DUF924 family protein [Sphingomicrobium sp.]|jgi:uncharacterized protein (DUF924 family)
MTSPEGSALATVGDVLSFWRKAGPDRWYKKDKSFDADIRSRFLATYRAAAAGSLLAWADTAEGALALVIVLDQFPRNLFRGSAEAYATDPLARRIANAAIARGFDKAVAGDERQFFYMPLMHSESLADQERCVALIRAAKLDGNISYAEEHADIIRRFGRFPHRNALLGRPTTAAEQAFLDAGGFAG